MTLPASGYGLPLSGRLTPTGELAQTAIVMIAADTGFFWRAYISGAGPSWSFTAAPSCADIAIDFDTCIGLAAAVATCAQLVTWGYS